MNPLTWQPPEGEGCIYLGSYEGDVLVGVFAFFALNCAMCDMHVCFTKKGLGHTALNDGIMALNWVWRYTDFNRIIGQIPVGNSLAIKYSERLGFVRFGLNPSSWLKNGEYHDLVMVGITRG
jgi:hypothetical protein